MAELQPYRNGYYLWKYVPSLAAAVIFCLIFSMFMFAYCWRIWKTRSWFCIPFAIGCYMEMVGYAGRAGSHKSTGRLMPYVIQNTNILLAPIFFAATIYMILGRLIASVDGERHSLIKLKWLTKIFVTSDVLTLMIQGSGAGIMIISNLATIGRAITIVGLIAQIIIFGLFWTTTFLFHRRMKRDPLSSYVPSHIKWEQALHVLHVINACIMGRSIFRVVEFITGADGYLFTVEWPLYIFDTLPMLGVTVLFWWFYPLFANSRRGASMISLQSLIPAGPQTDVGSTLENRLKPMVQDHSRLY